MRLLSCEVQSGMRLCRGVLQKEEGGAEMTVGELIKELEKLPQDLTVMAAGETAQRVIIEECQGNRYVRIFEPWDVEFVGEFIAEEVQE